MGIPTARVNLAVPVDIMIQIEKECDRRGISRAQFIKEAIHDKLKSPNEEEVDLIQIREDINEIKKIILLTLKK
jgi:hypothetical protein